jgi:hypothetical protein
MKRFLVVILVRLAWWPALAQTIVTDGDTIKLYAVQHRSPLVIAELPV